MKWLSEMEQWDGDICPLCQKIVSEVLSIIGYTEGSEVFQGMLTCDLEAFFKKFSDEVSHNRYHFHFEDGKHWIVYKFPSKSKGCICKNFPECGNP